MELDEQIRRSLKNLAADVGPVATILAKVKSVDDVANTCVIIEMVGNTELELTNVRLRPVLNGKEAVTMYPKVDSYVLCTRIEGGESWMVIGIDEADKMRVAIDNTVFEIKDGFLVQRGTDTLKQALTKIIDSVKQIVVLYGNNPDYTGLSDAQAMVNNLFK